MGHQWGVSYTSHCSKSGHPAKGNQSEIEWAWLGLQAEVNWKMRVDNRIIEISAVNLVEACLDMGGTKGKLLELGMRGDEMNIDE